MDISSIASMYSDTYATAANQAASKLQNQIGGTDYSKAVSYTHLTLPTKIAV